MFVYKNTLYYPYGASTNLYKETMASNLMMWEAIKFGKKLGLKKEYKAIPGSNLSEVIYIWENKK